MKVEISFFRLALAIFIVLLSLVQFGVPIPGIAIGVVGIFAALACLTA